MTQVVLQYKQIFNYADLKKSPNDVGTPTYKKSLQRRIELQTPIYALRKHYLKDAWITTKEAIINF